MITCAGARGPKGSTVAVDRAGSPHDTAIGTCCSTDVVAVQATDTAPPRSKPPVEPGGATRVDLRRHGRRPPRRRAPVEARTAATLTARRRGGRERDRRGAAAAPTTSAERRAYASEPPPGATARRPLRDESTTRPQAAQAPLAQRETPASSTATAARCGPTPPPMGGSAGPRASHGHQIAQGFEHLRADSRHRRADPPTLVNGPFAVAPADDALRRAPGRCAAAASSPRSSGAVQVDLPRRLAASDPTGSRLPFSTGHHELLAVAHEVRARFYRGFVGRRPAAEPARRGDRVDHAGAVRRGSYEAGRHAPAPETYARGPRLAVDAGRRRRSLPRGVDAHGLRPACDASAGAWILMPATRGRRARMTTIDRRARARVRRRGRASASTRSGGLSRRHERPTRVTRPRDRDGAGRRAALPVPVERGRARLSWGGSRPVR